MKRTLIVIDMQNDFISGSLGTKEAQAIVENVKNKIRGFDGEVLFTRDTHYENYLETQEGKNLPVKHCIKDTWGWEIEKSIDELRDGMVQIISNINVNIDYPEYDDVDIITNDVLIAKKTIINIIIKLHKI